VAVFLGSAPFAIVNSRRVSLSVKADHARSHSGRRPVVRMSAYGGGTGSCCPERAGVRASMLQVPASGELGHPAGR
jgi:hypothetical protein